MKAKIVVRYNHRIINDNLIQSASILKDNGISATLRIFDTTLRTKKTISISGYFVGDTWVGYPLFSHHGGRQRRLSVAEYNDMVADAEIEVDKYTKKENLVKEFVLQNEEIIKESFKK